MTELLTNEEVLENYKETLVSNKEKQMIENLLQILRKEGVLNLTLPKREKKANTTSKVLENYERHAEDETKDHQLGISVECSKCQEAVKNHVCTRYKVQFRREGNKTLFENLKRGV